jgi:hypothetical protein
MKDLAYYRANAEEDYVKVPISVLRYISELENAVERMYSEEDMFDCWEASHTGGLDDKSLRAHFNHWFKKFKNK